MTLDGPRHILLGRMAFGTSRSRLGRGPTPRFRTVNIPNLPPGPLFPYFSSPTTTIHSLRSTRVSKPEGARLQRPRFPGLGADRLEWPRAKAVSGRSIEVTWTVANQGHWRRPKAIGNDSSLPLHGRQGSNAPGIFLVGAMVFGIRPVPGGQPGYVQTQTATIPNVPQATYFPYRPGGHVINWLFESDGTKSNKPGAHFSFERHSAGPWCPPKLRCAEPGP